MSFSPGAYRSSHSTGSQNWVARNGLAPTHGASEMTADDHNGFDKRALVMVTIQDGAWHLLPWRKGRRHAVDRHRTSRFYHACLGSGMAPRSRRQPYSRRPEQEHQR
jgi:hypothetical protein